MANSDDDDKTVGTVWEKIGKRKDLVIIWVAGTLFFAIIFVIITIFL